MFTKISPGSVRSEKGFSITIISRTDMEYKQENKKLTIYIEPCDDIAIYESSIDAWETPAGKEYISKEEKALIIKNVCDALDFLKVKYELV